MYRETESEFDKRGILLSSVGAATYKLIRNLKQSSFLYIYKDIIRFKFNSSNRESGESVATYVAFYKQLNELCNFRDSLQHMLSNWLVCGINDTQFRDISYLSQLERIATCTSFGIGRKGFSENNYAVTPLLLTHYQPRFFQLLVTVYQ